MTARPRYMCCIAWASLNHIYLFLIITCVLFRLGMTKNCLEPITNFIMNSNWARHRLALFDRLAFMGKW